MVNTPLPRCQGPPSPQLLLWSVAHCVLWHWQWPSPAKTPQYPAPDPHMPGKAGEKERMKERERELHEKVITVRCTRLEYVQTVKLCCNIHTYTKSCKPWNLPVLKSYTDASNTVWKLLYSRKRWRSLNLAIWPQTDREKILNLAVASQVYLSRSVAVSCLRHLNKVMSSQNYKK